MFEKGTYALRIGIGHISMGNNQVRTIIIVQTVRTIGGAHLSPSPNLAIDRDPLDSHTPQGLAPMRIN